MTEEQMRKALSDSIDTNLRLTHALAVAIEFAPIHVKQKIADALGGKLEDADTTVIQPVVQEGNVA